jgi:DNA-binding transcriptional LysR family regulator
MKQHFTVRQGALDCVEAFLSVAQHRSFRAERYAHLRRVGAVLFIRTTRSVGLTEAGD